MSNSNDGGTNLSWWYDYDKMLEIWQNKAKQNQQENKNSNNSQVKSNSSFFATTQKVSIEDLVNPGVILPNAPKYPYDNKKIEVSGQIIGKNVENGKPIILISKILYNEGEIFFGDGYRVSLSSGGCNVLTRVFVILKDIKELNKLNEGDFVTVKGVPKCNIYKINTWQAYKTDPNNSLRPLKLPVKIGNIDIVIEATSFEK